MWITSNENCTSCIFSSPKHYMYNFAMFLLKKYVHFVSRIIKVISSLAVNLNQIPCPSYSFFSLSKAFHPHMHPSKSVFLNHTIANVSTSPQTTFTFLAVARLLKETRI